MARVLLIDDSKFTLVQNEKVFKGLEYEILKATSGEEALEVLGKNEVDLVTCDLLMPETPEYKEGGFGW